MQALSQLSYTPLAFGGNAKQCRQLLSLEL